MRSAVTGLLGSNAGWFYGVAAVAFLGAAIPAHGDVTISSAATQNMSCANGVCTPTAADAVLNVSDLDTMLASGNVTVTTTGSGIQANNIDVTANIAWSTSTLTLDAYQSLSVSSPVTATGISGLSVLINDGGSGGELAFSDKGHVTFKKLASKFFVNGVKYKLVNSISMLAGDIAENPTGNYALADNYDASKDGSYSNSPVGTNFGGAFEGLGNAITKLSINVAVGSGEVALFAFVQQQGVLRDVFLLGESVQVAKKGSQTLVEGALAGFNEGSILRAYAAGNMGAPALTEVGGLVGQNDGQIQEAFAKVDVKHPKRGNGIYAGGLVGVNNGQISASYSSGRVDSGDVLADAFTGGLVGFNNNGLIVNCYATGKTDSPSYAGGLIGYNLGEVSSSYSMGAVVGGDPTGGLIGADYSSQGDLQDTYWDTDTSGVSNLSQGAGYPTNDPGITGLSTEQLQSGLPDGFDPGVWGENTNLNGGLPYLLAIPPKH